MQDVEREGLGLSVAERERKSERERGRGREGGRGGRGEKRVVTDASALEGGWGRGC